MKKLTLLKPIIGTMAIFLVFSIAYAGSPQSEQLLAQRQIQRPQTQKLNKNVKPLKINVDPYIYTVCANNHYCDQALSGVNALLLQHITVVVGNKRCRNTQQKHKATGKVKVSFFSYSHGRQMSKTVPFSVEGEQTIKVFSGLYLIKKSTGITAEITELGRNQVDCDTGNNKKTVKKWMSCAVVK